MKEATHYHEQFGPMDKRSAVKGFVVCKIWDYNALKPVHRHNLIIDLLCLLKEMLIESIKSNNRCFVQQVTEQVQLAEKTCTPSSSPGYSTPTGTQPKQRPSRDVKHLGKLFLT